jgi:hypothetical protein
MLKEPLDYQRTPLPSHRSGSKTAFIGGAIGLAVTVPALAMAIASGGAGHGTYAAARLLYPIPMLLTRISGDEIGFLSSVIALLQFSIYGAVTGWHVGIRQPRSRIYLTALLLAHGAAALACFCGAVPNFS